MRQTGQGSAGVPTPESVLGYRAGEARKLPDWHEMVAFFDQLAAASDRVQVERLGESTLGLPYLAVTITSPENLARRNELRGQLARLYDTRDLSAEDERQIIDNGKVTAFLLCTQHSNEIGAAVMTMELASDLASKNDPETLDILDNVVTVIIPTHNPDGHQMIVEWYRQWLDTPYEGQPMPWLYHRYVGHDNNRDWFMLTQAETKLYAELHNREHPQLVFDMHQMYRDGARFMVPPFIDPLDPNQDPVIQQGFADLGTWISSRLTAEGKAGVASNIIFDNYSPSLAYGNYHGSVDLLSEAASCNLATPVTIEEDKFSPERGFDPTRRTWNHPMPWKGGEWTLRDIVEYDKIAALAFLEHAARNRRQWLRNYAGIMRRTVEREYAGSEATDKEKVPYAYIIPEQQDDPVTTWEMLDILRLGAVEIEEAVSEISADGVRYPAGTRVIRVGQPSGNYVKTLLEVQSYPDLRRWPDGPPSPPYDIAGHTLPLQMGVRCIEVARPFDGELRPANVVRPEGSVSGEGRHGWMISPRLNQSIRLMNTLLADGVAVYRAAASDATREIEAGAIVIPAGAVTRERLESLARETGVDIVGIDAPLSMQAIPQVLPRVGVYQSWKASIDEGWTRWLFEEYALPYETLHDTDVQQGSLRDRFDVIVLPQHSPDDILKGNPEKNKYKEPYPPEYVGGLGQLGVDGLREFAEAGGTLVALDSAAVFAIRHLYLPVRNVVEGLKEEEFYCPGSLLRVIITPSHPTMWGLSRSEVVLFMKSPVFEATQGDTVTVVASYPQYEPNVSGWILGADKIAGKAAMVEVQVGETGGKAILIGFRPQFRAQARGTYKALFNSVMRGGQSDPTELSLG